MLVAMWDMSFDRLEKLQNLKRTPEVHGRICDEADRLMRMRGEIRRRLVAGLPAEFTDDVDGYLQRELAGVTGLLHDAGTRPDESLELIRHRDDILALVDQRAGRWKL